MSYLLAILTALVPLVIAYKDPIISAFGTLFPPEPAPSPENGKSSLEFYVPPGVGISRYTLHRDRAEYSYVELWFFNRKTNDWVLDHEVGREERKDAPVAQPLNNPSAFQANPKGFRIRVSGKWMPNNSNQNKFARVVGIPRAQSYTFNLYAREGDPHPTMIAIVHFDRKLPGT
ncbi:hypothetical protein ACFPYM_04635 [Methylobacterium hispanicum]|uniref:hypothetical protein n=1 Tax=Methylobacterium hispanicum TaxID=270350 RepID=UPI001EDE8414|nr:hypothetical protein [Methylobacterium hispanicum]